MIAFIFCFILNVLRFTTIDAQLPGTPLQNSNTPFVSEMQFLRHLLIEERQSRKALEAELDKLKMEVFEIRMNTSFQGDQIRRLTAKTEEMAVLRPTSPPLRVRDSFPLPASVPDRSVIDNKNLSMKILNLERNTSDVYTKLKTMNSYFGDIDYDIKQLGQTLVELLNKMAAMESNITNTDSVLTAYRSQLVTNSLALNYSLVEMEKLKSQTSMVLADGGKKIGFYAFSNNAVPSWTGNNKIVFEKVVTNVGNSYNETSGVFRAPQRGLYVFIWTMTTYEGHSFNSYLVKNNVDVKYLYINGGARGGYETGSTSAVLELNRGDRIWIRGGNGGRLDYPNIVFTGFKL